jgi:hypothetical protein
VAGAAATGRGREGETHNHLGNKNVKGKQTHTGGRTSRLVLRLFVRSFFLSFRLSFFPPVPTLLPFFCSLPHTTHLCTRTTQSTTPHDIHTNVSSALSSPPLLSRPSVQSFHSFSLSGIHSQRSLKHTHASPPPQQTATAGAARAGGSGGPCPRYILPKQIGSQHQLPQNTPSSHFPPTHNTSRLPPSSFFFSFFLSFFPSFLCVSSAQRRGRGRRGPRPAR